MRETMRRVTALERWLQIAAVLVAASALWATFSDVSAGEVAGLISAAGLVLLLPPLAFASAQLLDTRACQLLARRLDLRLPFGRVFVAQIASEAATMALPLGFLVGESLRPWLLGMSRHGAVPAAIAAVAGRKVLLILTEGWHLGLAIALSLPTALATSRARFGSATLVWVGLALAVAFVSIALCLRHALVGGHLAQSGFRGLMRIAPRALRHRLERAEAGFNHTDGEFARLCRLPPRDWLAPLALYAGVWLLEGLEAWLILKALGAEVDVYDAIYIEAIVATSRAIVPALPAGLGLQDAGYVLFLSLLRVPDAAHLGAAFCVVKRSREVLWCMLGAACFAVGRRATPAELWTELAQRPAAAATSADVMPQ